ncbi:MAG: protein-disulfide reductase DsbD family protein [Luteolibacter sp.]
MFAKILFPVVVASAVAHAGVHSGKATADLLAESTTYQPGQPVHAAVRLKMDPGWHTYWSNPGEGGMKIDVKWQLPEGWTAGEPGHPVPKAFLTGGLAGYGYEGTVIFPLTLTPPAEASGKVKATATISWLTCNDDACIPGKAEISLEFEQDEPAQTPDAEAIRTAREKLPRPLAGTKLTVTERGKSLELTLSVPESLNLTSAKVFPETPQAVDPSATLQFMKSGDVWTATVAKNEYASGPLKTLSLVIGSETPVRVTWNAENP